MTKVTRYTSIEELKESKNYLAPQKSDSERESELREFIALSKNNSSTPQRLTSKFLK
jgi:hypothetical protein